MKRLAALTVMGLLVLPAASAFAGAEAGKAGATAHLADTIKSSDKFTTFWKAAEATGFVEELKEQGTSVTLLVPTDEAFAKLPAGELDRLMKPENSNELAKLLKNHVLKGEVLSGEIAGKATKLPAFSGEMLAIEGVGGTATVNGAKVTAADIRASNGVVHAIDQVLVPKG